MRSNAHRGPTYCPEMCFHCLRCEAALEAAEAEAEAGRAVVRCDQCGEEMPARDACLRLRDEGARGREASEHVFCPSCAAEYDEEIGPSRADEDDATDDRRYSDRNDDIGHDDPHCTCPDCLHDHIASLTDDEDHYRPLRGQPPLEDH